MVAVLIGVTALWYGGNPPEITAAISVITWWAIALGLAFGLIPVSRLAKAALIPVALLGSLTVLTGLSFFWTNNEGLAFDKTVQMTCILGLFVVTLLCSTPGSAKAWLRGIAFGLTFLVVLAAFSRFFPDLGNDPELRDSLYGSAGRLSWPLGYWNALGAIAAMATIIVAWFAATLEDVRWRIACIAVLPTFFLVLYLTSSRGALAALIIGTALVFYLENHRKSLLLAYAAGLTGGAILVLVGAQMSDLVHADLGRNARIEGAALLGLDLVVTGGMVALLKRYESRLQERAVPRPSKAVWIGVGIVALVGLIAFNPIKQASNFFATPAIEKEENVDDSNQTTVHLLSTGDNGRWQYWSVATDAFKDEPVYGIGAGGYQNYYVNNRDTLLFGRNTHSLPLRFASELGLIGFLIATAFLISVLWIGWKRWQTDLGLTPLQGAVARNYESKYLTPTIPPFAALILAGMVSMSLDWTSEFPVVAAPVLISMAALIGPATRKGSEPVKTSSRDLRQHRDIFPRELPAVLAILASGLAILISVYGFGISKQIEQSRDALRNENVTKALQKSEDAVALAPWSETALLQLAAAQEAAGNDIGALDSLDRAVNQAPLDSAPWFAKLRIAGRMNDSVGALEALKEAIRLDPYAPPFDDDSEPGITPVPGPTQ